MTVRICAKIVLQVSDEIHAKIVDRTQTRPNIPKSIALGMGHAFAMGYDFADIEGYLIESSAFTKLDEGNKLQEEKKDENIQTVEEKN